MIINYLLTVFDFKHIGAVTYYSNCLIFLQFQHFRKQNASIGFNEEALYEAVVIKTKKS
jgi:hypothetical protein